MVSSLPKLRAGKTADVRDTLLTPRFWTTHFQVLEALDISAQEPEMKAMMQEFIADYNQKHFVRNAQFEHSFKQLNAEERQLFLAFLERSCMSEFSGFLLYKEASLRLRDNNPLLAEGFKYLSRDEARHAGFLNRAMADSGLSLDLSHLTKCRNYTLIKPQFLFYATYLSEKIGYWKYIIIFRHLQRHPEFLMHPLFEYFHDWCQDESRHGDFMGSVIKSQPHWLTGTVSRLQIRLFLLLFVLTTYFSGQKSTEFYKMIGMNVKAFDLSVLKSTNKDVSKIFPIYLDLEHPQFVKLLDACVKNNKQLVNQPQRIGKLPFYILNGFNILRMYCLPVKESLPKGTIS